jgi:HD-GYP domain-containing protein (c-di-GMP phosphodiesterase class II)
MLLLAPLPAVPLLAGGAAILAMGSDILRRTAHRDRWLTPLGDSWFVIGPVLVLAALAPGDPTLELTDVYVLALAAQMLFDFTWTIARNALLDGLPVRDAAHHFAGTARVELILSPVAFVTTLVAHDDPLALLAIGPLVWLLELFSRDRRERYSAALELQRAYRGTVTLLSDVVEHEDPYTAAHSRSIVELVEATAEKMGVRKEERQRLEFAALLHDVGKIAIPKDILNKPAKLTDEEFALMKTHTIEGQLMLDRVGGLLGEIGEIVRSCHERWDGRGYPDGLAGERIPFAARIVFACDAYNAMTTDRVYRAGMSREDALDELARNAGTQFDPAVVDALTAVILEDGEPAVTTGDEIRAILSHRSAPARVGVVS